LAIIGNLAFLGAVAGTAAIAAGILLLRAANRGVSGNRILKRVGGWLLVVAGFCLWNAGHRADLTSALAALVFSLIGYGVVAASVEMRSGGGHGRRQRHDAADPLARPRRPWRIVMRIVLAGPMSLLFGIAVTLLMATQMPTAAVNALILGALLGLLAFAGGMAWSLSAERLSRVLIGLGVSSLLMAGLSSWRM
jgi:hypothetical protein